ncbi:MAG: hypothetical protein AAF928_13525 [Myxococcota bacterium]
MKWWVGALALVTGCALEWGSLEPNGDDAAASTSTNGRGGTEDTGSGGGLATTPAVAVSSGTSNPAGGGVAPAEPCLIALTDPFDTFDPAVWDARTEGVDSDFLLLPDGALRLRSQGAGSQGAGPEELVEIASVTRFDLTACGVMVEVDDITVTGEAEVGFEVVDFGTQVGMRFDGGYEAYVITGNANLQSSVEANAVDRYWMVRPVAGCVSFEVSEDGVSFTQVHTNCVMAFGTSMEVVLYARVKDDGNGGDARIVIRGVNAL